MAGYMMDQACQVTAVDALFNGESGNHAEVVYGILSTSLGKKVVAHTHASMDGTGGLSGDMQKLTLTCEDGSQVPVVVKRTREAGVEQSKIMGLAREGYHMHSSHPSLLPSISLNLSHTHVSLTLSHPQHQYTDCSTRRLC